MEYTILTGMSGAGKSTALKVLEDIGYFCVDNLPVPLLDKFLEVAVSAGDRYQKTAFGIDIRSGDSLEDLLGVINDLRKKDVALRLIYLDASDEVLLKRYKETRRNHPLAGDGRIEDGIRLERGKTDFLRREADTIIDTSSLLTKQLRSMLESIFSEGSTFQNLMITVLSFGFKYGLPADADLVFDVRFLPNPHYVPELRPKTGDDPDVQAYVRQGGQFDAFMEKLNDLMRFLIPRYIEEGKNNLVIAVGCTGGRHRSVTVANALYQELAKDENVRLNLTHRDVQRG